MSRTTQATKKLLATFLRLCDKYRQLCFRGKKHFCEKIDQLKKLISELKRIVAKMIALDRIQMQIMKKRMEHHFVGIDSLSLKYQLQEVEKQRLELIRYRNKILKLYRLRNV